MGVPKKTTDLRDQYGLHLEIGLILALTVLIVAFRAELRTRQTFQVQMQHQETVDMTEVLQTKQEEQPPPPPRPPVPIEVPNNEVVDQERPNFDASLDMDQALDTSVEPPSTEDAEEESEEKERQEIFVAVEEQPELIGGMQALQDDVKYPEFAKKAGLEGRVIVQFVVDENGDVQNPRVTRGVHELLDKAAIEAVKKQKFKPGKQRGTPVKVRMSLPVTFRLEKRR